MEQIYGLDAEWSPEHELVVAYAYDVQRDRYIEITPDGARDVSTGKMYPPDTIIDGVAYYYAAFDDVELTKDIIRFRHYRDANLLISVNLNKSTREEKRRKRMRDLTYDILGYPMKHILPKEVLANIREATPAVKTHCKEDARCVARLAAMFRSRTPDEKMVVVDHLQTFAEPWQKLIRTPMRLDIQYLKEFTSTEALLAAQERLGLDLYNLEDGKLHQNLKATQAWLESRGLSYDIVARTPFAKKNDGLQKKVSKKILLAYLEPNDANNKFRWLVGDVKDKMMDDTIRQETQVLYHLALKRDSQREFGEICYHSEQLCAQDSGRFSPRDSPLAQGSLLRASIIPPEGYFTASLDIQAQEPHLCGAFSGDLNLQEDLSKDLYSGVWSAYTGEPYRYLKHKNRDATDAQKRDNDNRGIAKSGITLPYFYGIGYAAMASALGIAPQAAQALITRLDERYDRLTLFRETLCRRAVSLGEITDAYHNWPLKVDRFHNEKQTFNHAIQGSGASMLREWTVDLINEGHKVFHTLHDGIYLYLPDDDITESGKSDLMDSICERSMDLLNERFPLGWKSWNVEGVAFYRCDSNPNGRLYEKTDYEKLETLIGGSQ